MDQVLKVSKRIWNAMHEIDIETLNELVHEDAKFVHMGVTLSHKDEIEVIKNKKIIYDLYNKGIFQIKDAVTVIAKLLNISKNTVYLHLRKCSNHKF